MHYRRHWTHSQIHETLVDSFTIQQEIHPGIFAVMDGVIAGDGFRCAPCAPTSRT
ncbi:MAG: hypothetical protein U0531_11410 [Dehalococcoidia bacterium]